MGVLSELEPKSVFGYFEEITGIPHGSGNVGQISDYLVNFAEEHGLFYIRDEWKNVIIVKEASSGYENEPTVILQGHMDMVAVKKPGCDIDMSRDGLRVAVDGDRIYAEGTSLGGDDGIAVAYALALLSSDSVRHPRLEVILTVDEEVGMDGARNIDLSMLTGHRMVNLDSEEEGVFLSSCAGGARVKCRMQTAEQEVTGTAYLVTVDGLLGGHSGGEIHKERGNSNCLFGRFLYRLCEHMPVKLAKLQGGLADNAIPRETSGLLVIDEKDSEKFVSLLDTVEKELQAELCVKDPDVRIRAEKTEIPETVCMTAEDTARAAAFLVSLPNGVQAMSADMPGLVETSLNLGILEYRDGAVWADFSVRSSVESAKRALIQKLCAVTELAGGKTAVSGDYPGWRFRKDSPLRKKMVSLYEEMYGEKPRVEAIHAGLECGILGSKIEDLDCVSMGPDMQDIHTTEESLSISSVRRVWEYLVRLLEKKEV
ncbi:MAG: aminoacyl-histidine dipeptidase [bacterium]|nr:aminoacyl-histidine dipeptidase [bacterium]